MLVFVSMLLSFQLTSCQKAREKRWCKHPIKIPQRVVDYFYFKEGTYWVYENETTHELDSQWVCNSVYNSTEPYNGGCNCFNKLCYQIMGVTILSKDYPSCENNKTYLSYEFNYDANTVQNNTSKKYTFKMKFNISQLFPSNNTGFGIIVNQDDEWKGIISNIKDTTDVVIKGINYHECLLFRDPNGNPNGKVYSNDIYQECILARNVGYVRYKDPQNQYWCLIRKNIMQ
jgi:hypothetical protein